MLKSHKNSLTIALNNLFKHGAGAINSEERKQRREQKFQLSLPCEQFSSLDGLSPGPSSYEGVGANNSSSVSEGNETAADDLPKWTRSPWTLGGGCTVTWLPSRASVIGPSWVFDCFALVMWLADLCSASNVSSSLNNFIRVKCTNPGPQGPPCAPTNLSWYVLWIHSSANISWKAWEP